MEGERTGEALNQPKHTATVVGIKEVCADGIFLEIADHSANTPVIMALPNDVMVKYGLMGKLKVGTIIRFDFDGFNNSNFEIVSDAERLDNLSYAVVRVREDDGQPIEDRSFFLALGKAPDKAVIAWIMWSREHVNEVLRSIGLQLDKESTDELTTALNEMRHIPNSSDRRIETLVGEQAQSWTDRINKMISDKFNKMRFKPVVITGRDFSGSPLFGDGLGWEDDDD